MTLPKRKSVPLAADILSRVMLPVIAKRKTYQPVYLNGRLVSKGGRESYMRWEQIEKVIDAHGIKSVVDLGCAEGFFVRKAVEKGCFATGIDADVKKLLWAQTTLALDGLEPFGFIKMHATLENLRHVPEADMVIFLSVHHHIMYTQGEEYALKFLQELRGRTRRVMIFEMGQSNEEHYPWARQLPDMGSDPHQWIADYLKRAGFREVQALCRVKSHKDKAERVTLAAYI